MGTPTAMPTDTATAARPPGDPALRRRRPDGRTPPLATNSWIASTGAAASAPPRRCRFRRRAVVLAPRSPGDPEPHAYRRRRHPDPRPGSRRRGSRQPIDHNAPVDGWVQVTNWAHMSIETLVRATGGADHIGFASYIEKGRGVARGYSSVASVTTRVVCSNMQASAVVWTSSLGDLWATTRSYQWPHR